MAHPQDDKANESSWPDLANLVLLWLKADRGGCESGRQIRTGNSCSQKAENGVWAPSASTRNQST